MPTTTTGAIWLVASRLAWISEPLPQAKRPFVCSSKSSSRIVVNAARANAVADPARISRVGPDAPPAESSRTKPAAASPPRNASPPAGSTGSDSPNAAAAVTARNAPALTPSVSGDANVFRTSDCNAAPATPRATPTSRPARSRGSREATSTFQVFWSPSPRARRTRSPTPTDEVPCTRWNAASTTTPARARTTTPASRSGRGLGASAVALVAGSADVVVWVKTRAPSRPGRRS